MERSGDRVKNLFKFMLISLVLLFVLGAGIVFGVSYFSKDISGEARSIEEINKYSYETSELTTDLNDGKFVRVQFQIVTNGKKGLKEVKQREFQIKNTLIKELAVMNEEDFKTGLTEVEEIIKSELNELMTDGEITDVYTINKILQ